MARRSTSWDAGVVLGERDPGRRLMQGVERVGLLAFIPLGGKATTEEVPAAFYDHPPFEGLSENLSGRKGSFRDEACGSLGGATLAAWPKPGQSETIREASKALPS